MATELNEMIRRLPPDRQKRIRERGRELIAEEMARRNAGKACDMTGAHVGQARRNKKSA